MAENFPIRLVTSNESASFRRVPVDVVLKATDTILHGNADRWRLRRPPLGRDDVEPSPLVPAAFLSDTRSHAGYEDHRVKGDAGAGRVAAARRTPRRGRGA